MANALAKHSELSTPVAEIFPATPRILIVEDDKANAFIISTMLDLLGYEYDWVETGEKALEAVKCRPYPIILMDIVLNGMCGIETTKSIRAYERAKGVAPAYIIAATALSDTIAKAECEKAGMNDYLRKPHQLEVISDRLESWQHSRKIANK